MQPCGARVVHSMPLYFLSARVTDSPIVFRLIHSGPSLFYPFAFFPPPQPLAFFTSCTRSRLHDGERSGGRFARRLILADSTASRVLSCPLWRWFGGASSTPKNRVILLNLLQYRLPFLPQLFGALGSVRRPCMEALFEPVMF